MNKRNNRLWTTLAVLACSCTMMMGCGSDDDGKASGGAGGSDADAAAIVAKPVEKTNAMNVYAHWMPWFETNTSNPLNAGKWGYHWTMANRNPDIVTDGKRQIAAHYYPLTGPYASGDEAILDYQCLLMKYSGIDGVMVDWYGVNSDNATALHKSNTEAMARAIRRAGLKMAIVYEDRTLEGVADAVTQARIDMRYLAETFFKQDYYVKVNGRPLLLVFGPIKMLTPKEWYRTFSILGTQPQFLVLNGHSSYANDADYHTSQGEYLWVNPKPDYSVAKNFETYIGGAMPGFWDYYKEGGAGDGYTTYDAENGALFARQLQAAKSANLSWLQVSTWNDYGEGTTIEPTEEYGYRYLVQLQQFTGVKYDQANLELIYRWYQARVARPNDEKVKQAWQYLVSLQPEKARELLNN
jgi:hypothetical protein